MPEEEDEDDFYDDMDIDDDEDDENEDEDMRNNVDYDSDDCYKPRKRQKLQGETMDKSQRYARLSDMYKETLQQEEHKYAAYIQSHTLHKREYYYHMHGQEADGSTVAEKGERRYRLFVYLIFSGLRYRLRKFQIEFTNLIIQSMAEKIIGPEAWKVIGQRIMKEFGWKKVPPKIVAAAAPRRYGKTVVVATVQSAVALVMGGLEQSTFSTGARASGSIRNYVRQFLIESGFAANLLTKGANNETIKVKTLYIGELPSILNFFPANGLISDTLSMSFILSASFVSTAGHGSLSLSLFLSLSLSAPTPPLFYYHTASRIHFVKSTLSISQFMHRVWGV